MRICGEAAMLKRSIVLLWLMTASLTANGGATTSYTDVYYVPAESGWGVFVVQSNTFQFLAFFIYDATNKPVWYTAQLTDDGTGTYSGPLYATTGSGFAQPWNPAQLTVNQVGTAKFAPINIYSATLTYTVNGIGTVVKTVQRQTLTPQNLAGTYSGSLSGSVSGCTNPASNVASFNARFNLTVTQVDDTAATFVFTVTAYNESPVNAVCTLTGPITQGGLLYQMPVASYSCPLSSANQAIINNFRVSGQGIEGRWHADDGGGCTESVHFSAVDLSLK
jgi:hypothetical protein